MERNERTREEHQPQFAAHPGDKLLWAGVLVAPIVWGIQMELNYLLVPRSCSTGFMLPLHLVTVVSLLAMAGGALAAWKGLARVKAEASSPNEVFPTRARFMGQFGLAMSGFMFLVALAQAIPTFLLHPCD